MLPELLGKQIMENKPGNIGVHINEGFWVNLSCG